MVARAIVKLERGQLFWRGSNDAWVFWPAENLERLRDLFRADHEPYSQDYADRIDRALEAYHNDQRSIAA